MTTFTGYPEYDEDLALYVGTVLEIPGAHTQGAMLDELQVNLEEILELCPEEFRGQLDDLPRFVDVQQLEIGLWHAFSSPNLER